MIFLSETKVGREKIEGLKDIIGFLSAFGVSSRGRAGGLLVFWREEKLDFRHVSFSQNHICGDVMNNGVAEWHFVGIYGWPEGANKHRTWTLVQHLCDEVEVPIIFGGDFNEILSYEEKEGGIDGK